MRGIASPNPFAGESLANSPVAGLAKDLNSSLHLDSSNASSSSLRRESSVSLHRRDNSGSTPSRAAMRPPAFEPFLSASSSPNDSGTPLLLRSRKRGVDDLGSPALALSANSPSHAFWARNQGRRAAPSSSSSKNKNSNSRQQLCDSPCSSSSMATARPLGLLFRHEGGNTDDDSSFDDDGSLTSLPRMRGSQIKTIMEEHVLESTPLRSYAGQIKRARSQTTAIPSFLPLAELGAPEPADILGPNFSPSARSQPECHLLPCFAAATDSIMRIEAETVGRLLQGAYNDLYDEHVVVDCRFPYEYEGGHIAGAVNAPTSQALEKLLLDRPMTDRRVVVVLHCEYSVQRAPSMACLLRRRDREVNMHRYPYLHYPEIYVLKGGYRNFFSFHKQQCEPQSYVEMNDEQFVADCRERMLQFNRQFKRTKSSSANDRAMSRSYSATVAGSALFLGSPTSMPQRSSSSSSLPTRARRMGRTQSARPGVNLIDFSQN
ncbi:m-phase inducer phosphatase [Coemansia erecta]|nr:m-phase inducer phosphatase [Coemansia erecta]